MKTKEIEVEGLKYVVSPIKMGVMKHILPRLNSDSAVDAQLDMMRACVSHNGETLGDKVDDLTLEAYLGLIPVVLEVNGMNVPETGEAGKG